MNDFAILAHLDFMRARNGVRTVLHSPGRLVVWILYVLWFAAMLAGRILKNSVPSAASQLQHGLREPIASMVAFGFILGCALTLIRAVAGQAGAFASKADARFLTASQLHPRNVAIWLQLRNSFGSILRFFYIIILYTMLFNTAGSMSGMTFSMALGTAFLGALAIPGLAAGKRFGAGARWILSVLAVVTAGAILALALAFVHVPTRVAAIPLAIEGLGQGHIVSAMLAGAFVPLAFLFMATVLLILTAYFCASDLYPELYAASLSTFESLRQRRAFGRGRAAGGYQLHSTAAARTALPGGWTLVWKEWLGFRRSRGARTTIIASAILIVAAGVAGIMAGTIKTAQVLLFGLAGPAFTLMVLIMTSTAVSLASDLRKPLWWLGPDPLRIRLYAWIVSITWRMSAIFFLVGAAYAITARSVAMLPWILALALLVPFTLRAVSLATYAILPAPADQRGPLAMLRLLITLALFIPPLLAFLFALLSFHNLAAELIALLLVCLVQIGGLVEFASWRINGAGSSYALAEQST